MDHKIDNLASYGCAFIILVGFGLLCIAVASVGSPESWFFRIYVVLNLSVLHVIIGASINESRKNPERKTYKVKGIRYKIDKINSIIWTTFGIGLWILIFCLDVWSIIAFRYDIEYKFINGRIITEEPPEIALRSVYHLIRQLITIPIAVLWAFCVTVDWQQKADQEEREASIE